MIGEKIRNLRKENKISQEELAEKLGVSRQSISLWENGQTMPSIENIVSIADIFGVSTDVLLKDKPIEEQSKQIEEKEEPKGKTKRKRTILIILLLTAVLVGALVLLISLLSNRKLSAEKIYAQISATTVEINAVGDTFESTGTGSFIDDNGMMVTNYHVIESCHTINITTNEGDTYKVESVLGFDKDRDLAIIKIDCQNNDFVKLRTGKIKTGEKVYTLGSSLGLTGTFSEGIVSSASRELDGFEFIQTTAPISSGNSGGPLVDEAGKVIGITTGAFVEGQNLNLAIPASAINKINTETPYSINEFFQVSQGKVIEREETTAEETVVVDAEYEPIDIGYFESLEELNEAAQRNPDMFKLPVIVSVYGIIARNEDDNIYLVSEGGFLFHAITEEGKFDKEKLLEHFDAVCDVYMIDDTRNKVLTYDHVIIDGIYRHSAQTLSDCTYELIN